MNCVNSQNMTYVRQTNQVQISMRLFLTLPKAEWGPIKLYIKDGHQPIHNTEGGPTMSYYLTQTNQVLIITCSNPVICCLTNKQDSQLEVQTNCETMLLCITSWNIGYRLTYRPRTLNTPWKYHKSPQCGPLMKWHIPPFQENRNYYIFYLKFSTPPILPFWYYPNLMVHGSYWGDLSHISEWYNWTI